MDKYEIHLIENHEKLAAKYKTLTDKCNQMSYLIGYMYSSLRNIQLDDCPEDFLDEVLASITPQIEELIYKELNQPR